MRLDVAGWVGLRTERSVKYGWLFTWLIAIMTEREESMAWARVQRSVYIAGVCFLVCRRWPSVLYIGPLRRILRSGIDIVDKTKSLHLRRSLFTLPSW